MEISEFRDSNCRNRNAEEPKSLAHAEDSSSWPMWTAISRLQSISCLLPLEPISARLDGTANPKIFLASRLTARLAAERGEKIVDSR
jgi:hypothetical protein